MDSGEMAFVNTSFRSPRRLAMAPRDSQKCPPCVQRFRICHLRSELVLHLRLPTLFLQLPQGCIQYRTYSGTVRKAENLLQVAFADDNKIHASLMA